MYVVSENSLRNLKKKSERKHGKGKDKVFDNLQKGITGLDRLRRERLRKNVRYSSPGQTYFEGPPEADDDDEDDDGATFRGLFDDSEDEDDGEGMESMGAEGGEEEETELGDEEAEIRSTGDGEGIKIEPGVEGASSPFEASPPRDSSPKPRTSKGTPFSRRLSITPQGIRSNVEKSPQPGTSKVSQSRLSISPQLPQGNSTEKSPLRRESIEKVIPVINWQIDEPDISEPLPRPSPQLNAAENVKLRPRQKKTSKK